MQTIIFDTTIKDGIIKLPPNVCANCDSVVRVIILESVPRTTPDMIDQLLAEPIHAPEFNPIAREAIHDRSL